MLDIRSGGLAIYGGIIAGALTVFVVCHVKKIYFPAFGDGVVPGVIMAQAIGRWGNFMNGEAYGYETDIFCRMGLGAGSSVAYYHPTFLYESLWNIVGFILINIFFKHKKYDGQIILLVFGWYGLGRAWIEGLRTDSLYIPGTSLRISQVLAIAIFLACLAMLIYFAIKPPKRELYVKKAPISESTDK
jgi:phosphatidylglycerol:prolipoprotein diacylglycerol transferase